MLASEQVERRDDWEGWEGTIELLTCHIFSPDPRDRFPVWQVSFSVPVSLHRRRGSERLSEVRGGPRNSDENGRKCASRGD